MGIVVEVPADPADEGVDVVLGEPAGPPIAVWTSGWPRVSATASKSAGAWAWALRSQAGWIGTRTWPDRATARAEVISCIETFYVGGAGPGA